ncbi:MAG: hypothetical protein AAGG44_05440 [Planctomycetota bacterium]
MSAQDEIDFLERFAFSADRREVLRDLIPGTEDFFYYHCLQYQNEGQLSEAEAVLTKWRTRYGESGSLVRMTDRQRILTYGENPRKTTDYLQRRLGLSFEAAVPQRRGEAQFPSTLDDEALNGVRLARQAMLQAPDLGNLEDDALPMLLEQSLNPSQLRAVLKRASYPGYPKLLDRIIEELRLRDSKGFGWAPVHRSLARAQLDALRDALPDLNGNRAFVLSYLQRLVPAAGSDWTSKEVQADYLQRVWKWAQTLPDAQRDLKAVAACNLLRFNLTIGKFDQSLFLEYLALPRNATYYRGDLKRTQRNRMIDTRFSPPASTRLGAVAQDESLVRAHLEHFFLQGVAIESFASWLDQEYLAKLEATTKILYGIGDPSVWYPKLSPDEQQELKQRVEVQFARDSVSSVPVGGPLRLRLQVKNLEDLVVRVYEIDCAEYYRQHESDVSTDVDLDGLVPNVEKRLQFDLPTDRRHQVEIDLTDELATTPRGVWVVDCVGGGMRSRAVLRRGALLVAQRVTDFGHRFQVMDERGAILNDAELEIGGRRFTGQDGYVFVPFAERERDRVAVAMVDDFASTFQFTHRQERYSLSAAVLLPRQSLVGDRTAAIAIRPDLRCVGRRVSLGLIEDANLTISALDANGVSAELLSRRVELTDSQDLTATFLVPRRLRRLEIELRGVVRNQSTQELDPVAFTQQIRCNELEDSLQIAQFYVQRLTKGTRVSLLGRNGEAQSLVPVQVEVKHRLLRRPLFFNLTTDAKGYLELGTLPDVELVILKSKDVRPWGFVPATPERSWPGVLCLSADQPLSLAIGTDSRPVAEFALWERRGGVNYADRSDLLQVRDGEVVADTLPEGDYTLFDLQSREKVDVAVVQGEETGDFLVGEGRIAEATAREPIVIRSVELENGTIQLRADGADELTRVHVIASTFVGDVAVASWIRNQSPRPTLYARQKLSNVYLGSRRLDEEYSYVLNRESGSARYGNMLPQPGLLLHPWEVNDTSNRTQMAAPGEAMPAAPADAAMAEPRAAKQERRSSATSMKWMAFNFLDQGSYILANADCENGSAEIKLDDLDGISEITVLVMNGDSTDSRTLQLDDCELATRDVRLTKALDDGLPYAQSQTVKLITQEQPALFERETVMEVNAFRSLQDVYRLYSTLLPAEWKKLEFLPRWASLSDDEKRSYYNSYACHELNLFLYRKDQPFFQKIVRPSLVHKLEKQFVDLWLLGEALDEFTTFPAVQRLNVLERILLLQRQPQLLPKISSHLSDVVAANEDPIASSLLFDAALRQTSQNGGSDAQSVAASVDFDLRMLGESLSEEDGLEEEAKLGFGRGLARGRGPAKASPMMRGVERLGRARKKSEELFQSVDRTREWAESQYYRLPLREQSEDLIPASRFWEDYLEFVSLGDEATRFLPKHLELSCQNINEAFAALALIDLPFEPEEWISEQQENNTLIQSPAAILYLKTVEAVESEEDEEIILGKATYLALEDLSKPGGKTAPIEATAFQTGVAYRTQVVVTNPTPTPREMQLLSQIPSGAIALEGQLPLTNLPINVQPYGTEKVDLTFYFPATGTFTFAGTRVNEQAVNIRQANKQELTVVEEPILGDLKSWAEIAAWGQIEQVVAVLRDAKLDELNLSAVEFRLTKQAEYEAIVSVLEDRMHYEDRIWQYSLLHQDKSRIATYMARQTRFTQGLGNVLDAELCPVDERRELRFEHLDYKPLILARSHQLGKQRRILNDGLEKQYAHLLSYLAHKPTVSSEEKLQVAYYLYLQNRMEEVETWLQQIDDTVVARPQLDYLKCNVDFVMGRYEDAASRALAYENYPLPRWEQLFAAVGSQYRESRSITTTSENGGIQPDSPQTNIETPSQSVLEDRRGDRQVELAKQSPILSLDNSGNALIVRYANLKTLTLRFFQMDLELLFSRGPFRVQARSQRPLIRPTQEETIELTAMKGELTLEIPAEMQGKNVLVEVAGAGISDTSVLTTGDLDVEVASSMGQVNVVAGKGRGSVAGAYVKVYAEHNDGRVRFFKDGYTDLRGRFDYATLSTNELDSVKRFAILVLDSERGAVVKEAKPPLK